MDQLTETYQRVSSYLRGLIVNNNISSTKDSDTSSGINDQQSTVINNSTNATNGEVNNPTNGQNGTSSLERCEQYEQLLSNLQQLYLGCQEILTFAHEYDYDSSDPANGFRSFVKIITIYFTKLDTMYRVISECNLNGKIVPPKFVKQLPDYMAVSVPFLVQLSILKLVRAKDLPLRSLLDNKNDTQQQQSKLLTSNNTNDANVNQMNILVHPVTGDNDAILLNGSTGVDEIKKGTLDIPDDLDQSSPSVSSSFEGDSEDDQEIGVTSAIEDLEEEEEEEDSVYTTADESSQSDAKSNLPSSTVASVSISIDNEVTRGDKGELTANNSNISQSNRINQSSPSIGKKDGKDSMTTTNYQSNSLLLSKPRNFYEEFLTKLRANYSLSETDDNKLDEKPQFNDACNYSDIDQVILEAVLGFGEKDIRPFYTDIRNFWIHDFIRRLLKGLHKGILMITCPPNQLMKMLFDPTITVDISTKRAVHCSVTDIRKAITVIESKPIRAIQALKYIGKGGSAWMIHVPRQSEWTLKAAEGPLSRATLHRSPRPRVHPRDQQDSDEDTTVANFTSLPVAMLSKFRPFANAATCINGNTSSSSSSSRSNANSVYNSFYSDGNGNNNTDPEQLIECLIIKPSTSSNVKSPSSPSPSSSPTIGTPSSTSTSQTAASTSTTTTTSTTTASTGSTPPKKSLIFHAHGGGFVAMSPRAHQNYLRYWSNQLGVPVICPNYGKAPERPYPCGLQDLLDVYLFITSKDPKVIDLIGFHPENIILTGDSAGGNLSPALAFVLNDMKKIIASTVTHDQVNQQNIDNSSSPLASPIIQMPAAIAVHYPAPTPTLIFDASKTSVTYDPILTTAKMITFFSAYHALDQSSDPNPWYRQDDLLKEIPKKLSIKAKDPYYNLMSYQHFDDLKDLKMYITACEFDALLDGAISFARAWKGPVVLDIARDLPHGFLVGAGRKELDKEIHLVTLRIAQGLGIEYSVE